jgi:hypothetical protein
MAAFLQIAGQGTRGLGRRRIYLGAGVGEAARSKISA